MALAEKVHNSGNIVLVFIGDGTLGEGSLYESINLASLWKIPILFVLEDNHYAQTTPVEKNVAGSMSGRFEAFGIPVWERESSDVLEIQAAAVETVTSVRSGNGPACLLIHTHRFSAHSKGDDTRSQAELDLICKFDPLKLHKLRLTIEECNYAETEVTDLINSAFERASADPIPRLDI
jgi:TPP-dependent pyruvate/acetoin dehydrogenase alpha subunit